MCVVNTNKQYIVYTTYVNKYKGKSKSTPIQIAYMYIFATNYFFKLPPMQKHF